ncbi:unnamed protein product [Calicophoron daubneyi]|uniref:Uncharacterized protein n=1 Tax=Calicophoron daubneyi TaxID=300641 RepID=A0AAV2TRT5_CALDB
MFTITDVNRHPDVKVFIATEICAASLNCVVYFLSWVTCCNRGIKGELSIAFIVLAGIAAICYLQALVFMTKHDCCRIEAGLPRAAWTFGALLFTFFTCIEAITSCMNNSEKT